ncbi:unnamed protein product [Cylicocyclus nassatus]|uniref:Carbohydrate sulfotransferase n=1 Tax=Cylicocyclus nassatus TaxID=53992 RepID=A0AA36MBN7_CYLNA|nr:unnamed protein product [Cylicocyclus nassatus]
MSFALRCFILALCVLFAVYIIIDKMGAMESGSKRTMRLKPDAPWYNTSYDAEIEFKNYAVYPPANAILTSLQRQARTNTTRELHQAWALAPFGPLRENIVIAPNYNIASCQIEKIMTTVRDAVFCYLTNPTDYEAFNRSLSAEQWTGSPCGWSNYRSNIDDVERETNTKFRRFAIIRNPFQRFLSAYVDKCLNERNFAPQVRCLGCRYDMKCFVERLFHLLYGLQYSRTYIAREIWYVARHFAPQSWQCNFKKQLSTYDIIVYPETSNRADIISNEFDRVFKQAGVPQELRSRIREELSKGRAHHSTYRSNARSNIESLITSDRYIRRILSLIYYYDYIVFGFDFDKALFD